MAAKSEPEQPVEILTPLDCRVTITIAGQEKEFELQRNNAGNFSLTNAYTKQVIPVWFLRYTIDSHTDTGGQFEQRELFIKAKDVDPDLPDLTIGRPFSQQRIWVDDNNTRSASLWKNISGPTVRMMNIGKDLEIRVEVGTIDAATGKILPKAQP